MFERLSVCKNEQLPNKTTDIHTDKHTYIPEQRRTHTETHRLHIHTYIYTIYIYNAVGEGEGGWGAGRLGRMTTTFGFSF